MVTIDVTPYCGASLTKDIEILAVQLYKNRNEKINLSLGAEGFDITFNGLEQAEKISRIILKFHMIKLVLQPTID